MKKILGFVMALAAVVSFGAQNDTLITFSSVGPDRYADGTTVKNGECYALVWIKTGATFPGFLADGTVAGTDARLLIVTARARGGRCPTTVFQVAADDVDSLTDGSYGVYLLDTRNAAGQPMGVKRDPTTGRRVPQAINGFGVVAGATTKVSTASARRSSSMQAAGSTKVTTTASVPADAPKPEIKSMRVENGKVYVKVAKTVPYLQYNLSKGATPDAVGKSAADVNVAIPAQGSAENEIEIEVPATGASGFFRVKRN